MYAAVAVASLLTLIIFLRQFLFSRKQPRSSAVPSLSNVKKGKPFWNYAALKNLITDNNIRMPAMLVDLNLLESNAKRIADIVRPTGKTLRMATKSIRSPQLIKRIMEVGQGVFKGLMCFSVEEAALLADDDHLDDFYIPYPTLQLCDVQLALDLASKGKKVTLTVDSVEHVTKLDELCESCVKSRKAVRESSRLRVAADLGVAYKLGFLWLGPHRSQLDSLDKFDAVVRAIRGSKHLVLVGVMGYEAHVAGLPDSSPCGGYPKWLITLLKRLFYDKVLKLRQAVASYCKKNDITLDFFNGGGTGNIRQVVRDSSLTEVTVGSGFLQAKIFDYFSSRQCTAAFCFALQATRVNPDYICCQSGGFVASGNSGEDKFPSPFSNPVTLTHFPDEGYGEVQTPLKVKASDEVQSGEDVIGLGDPVFFRPAKSGEIAEHFNFYHLIRCETGGQYVIVNTCDTYRGLGKAFY